MMNELLNMMKTHKVEAVRKHAKLLLGQLNTAGGDMIKREVQQFIDDNLDKSDS